MKEIEIKIKGMVCGGCEKRVENALKTIEGIKEVVADHTTGKVKIQADGDINKDIIKEKIEDIDFELEKE